MSSITLENFIAGKYLPLQDFVSKKERPVLRIMFGIFALEIFAFSLIARMWFVSDTSAYAMAAGALAERTYTKEAKNRIKVGASTEQFIKDLRSEMPSAALLQRITREPFSVEGALVAVGNDNIQVFEYPDHEAAVSEAVAFAQKYKGENSRNRWKNRMHLSVEDNLVIYYMGNNKDIYEKLDPL